MNNDDYVTVVTDLDTAHAIRNALGRVNCTFEELNDWAQTGNYPSIKHQLVWLAIGPYFDDRGHLASLLEGR